MYQSQSAAVPAVHPKIQTPYKIEFLNPTLRVLKGLFIPASILISLTIVLFFNHFCSDYTWIGNPDRLNNHLKIFKYHCESLTQYGSISAWNDHEMCGYDSFAMPYTFPNILTYITSWLGMDSFYHFSGYISLVLLIIGGISAYYCIHTITSLTWPALIGAICYQFSVISIQGASQCDMSFAVFIMIPLMLVTLYKLDRKNLIMSFVTFSIFMFILLNFMFLQMVSYVLIFLGLYVLYKSRATKSMMPISFFCGCFVVGILFAFPRIIEVALAVSQYKSRVSSDFYRGVYPSDIWRWFDNTIFGKYPSETGIMNQLNMTEGFLLYTSSFIPFLIIFGSIFYKNHWLYLLRCKMNEAQFMLAALILSFSIILSKYALLIIYLLYMKIDFTHARILVIGLLPLCMLIALILGDLFPKPYINNKTTTKSIFGISMFAGILIVFLIELISNNRQGYTEWPLRMLSNFEFLRHLHLSNGALFRIVLSAVIFIILLLMIKFSKSLLCIFAYYTLCFSIIFHVLHGAYYQINNPKVYDNIYPFTNGDYYFAVRDYFRVPNDKEIKNLHNLLENDKYRAALIDLPNTKYTGFFATGHVPEFWKLRVIDGYYGIGVPTRLASLPWPGNLNLRTINFNSDTNIPWKILGLLNVKYALYITPLIYRNLPTYTSNNEARPISLEDLSLIKNPEYVSPRVYFTAQITPVKDITEAVASLFNTDIEFNLQKHSFVEGISTTKQFPTEGAITLTTQGDKLEIRFDSAEKERFLILNELFFRGWVAKINAKKIDIYPANVTSRGILIPPHTDKLTMEYIPFIYSWKAKLFYFFGATCFLLGVLICKRKELDAF